LDEDFAHLLHLVGLREGVLWLKIENPGNTLMGEDVVTALDSFREPNPQKKTTKIPEADVGIRRPSQHLEENGIGHTQLCA